MAVVNTEEVASTEAACFDSRRLDKSYRTLMKKLILFSGLISATFSYAETQLDTQTVTATRLPENTINDAQLIIIDRENIEMSNAQSLPELLNLESGIQFTQNGGRLNTTNLYINGLDNKRITVLINGERVGSGTAGTTAFNLIAPEQVERIEIIQGARGALYGADAQGGVINIITRNETDNSQLTAAFGSDKNRELNLRTSTSIGRTSLYFNAQHDASDGYDIKDDDESDKDGHERYSIAGGAAIEISKQQKLALDYQRSKGNYEYDGNFGNNSDFDNQALSARYQIVAEQLTISAAAGRSEDNSWDYKDHQKRSADDLFATTKNTASLIGRYRVNSQHSVILGSDYQSTDISESGKDYDESTDNNTGIITGYRYTNSFASVELGARHDNNNRYGQFRSFNTQVVLTAENGDVISAGQATAFRTPTFNDLYYPGFGNDELEPERSRIWSLGYLRPYNNGSLKLNGQRAIFNNKITYNPVAFKSENIGKSSVDSVSLVWKHQWNSSLSSQLSQNWLDAKNDENGKRLRRISPRSSKAIIRYYSGGVSTQLEGIYYEGSPKSDGGERLASYSLFNASINYRVIQDLTVGLRLDNISDREYETISGYPAPRRSWMLKSRYRF